MKTLLLAALLFTSTTFAQTPRVPLPRCFNGQVQYANPNHFYADFCVNDRGINSPQECRRYQDNADPGLLEQEMVDFINKRAKKVCGK
jgi:hypothetical protein